MIPKSISAEKKKSSNNFLIKSFVKNLKKNTAAIVDLKRTIDKKNDTKNFDKVLEVTNSVNEKLEVVHKLRNDIKIYKTINTILTNHYITATKNQETDIRAKILNLEEEIRSSYNNLKDDLVNISGYGDILKENNGLLRNLSVQNNNFVMLGNNVNCNVKELHIKNQIYNQIISRIDKMFGGLVSFVIVFLLSI